MFVKRNESNLSPFSVERITKRNCLNFKTKQNSSPRKLIHNGTKAKQFCVNKISKHFRFEHLYPPLLLRDISHFLILKSVANLKCYLGRDTNYTRTSFIRTVAVKQKSPIFSLLRCSTHQAPIM